MAASACSRVRPPRSVLPTWTPGRTRPSYCWSQAYRTPAPMPMARTKPRTNETPKRKASDRRRRGSREDLTVGHAGRERQDRHGIDAGLGCRSTASRRRGGVGSRVGSDRAGRSSDARARSASAGPRPRQRRHLRACTRICHVNGRLGRQDYPTAGPPATIPTRWMRISVVISRPRRDVNSCLPWKL